MASLVIKNNTGSNVPIDDVGIFIPASGSETLTRTIAILQVCRSADTRALVTAGTITLNDGSSDLSVLAGLNYLDVLWSTVATQTIALLAPGYVSGARLAFVSNPVVSVGEAGQRSVIADSTGILPLAWTGLLNADIRVAGAGGLQTGQSEAANTWYQVLIIGDSSGTNAPAALLVPEGVGFSQSGYDIFRRVGYVRNDGSSNLLSFFQSGKGNQRTILYQETIPNLRVLNNGSATSYTDVDCSAFIPPIGRAEVMFQLTFDNSGGTAGNDLRVRPGDSTISNVPTRLQPGVIVTSSMQIPVTVFTDASQTIQYEVSVGSNVADIIVVGYRDDL